MGNLLGGSSAAAQSPVVYTGLDIQTSSAGVCIPMGWGAFRATPNILWANDFQAHAQKNGKGGGKGGGGKGGAASYTYTTALILGLIEGPIQGIGQVWVDNGFSSLAALNLTLFTGTTTQTPPAWIESNYPSQALSYARTAYLFSDNYNLGSSSEVPSHSFEVFGNLIDTIPGFIDACPADIIADLTTNPQYGLVMPVGSVVNDSWQQFKDYCIVTALLLSPYLSTQEQGTSIFQRWAQLTNSFIFWSGNQMKYVPLTSGSTSITANGATYTPNNVPLYDLGLDDFIVDPRSVPVTVQRTDPLDSFNSVELDINDRANNYNINPIVWVDQTSADAIGLLPSQIISATEVCNSSIAAIMASLIGLRSVNIRNTYQFKLPPQYFLLEPGDIVLITDPFIGLSKQPVRILTVDEDENYNLAITSEEYPAGLGIPAEFSPATNTASPPPNIYADPGDINTPLIIEPTPIITAGNPEIWIGASGGTNWGGCDVYISTDGLKFVFLQTIGAPTAQGMLTADLPAHTDPDTVDTLSVDMTISRQPISTAITHDDADSFQSVALVGTELIAFGAAAVSGTNTYNLTYLRRGVYNTPISDHPIGTLLSVINPKAVVQEVLPQTYVGVELYLKFTSFNSFGNSMQDPADVVEYTYTPTGVAYTIDPPPSASIKPSAVTQADGTSLITLTFSWTASGGPLLGSYLVEWGTDGTTWTGIGTGSATNLSYQLTPAKANTEYYLRVAAVSQNGQAVSSFATAGPVNSGPLVPKVPPTPSTLTYTLGSGGLVTLSWPASSDPAAKTYQIWRAAGLNQPFDVQAFAGVRRFIQNAGGRRDEDEVLSRSFGTQGIQIALLQTTTPSLGWVDTTAAPSADYTYWLVAINPLGSSQPGPIGGISLTTLP